MFGWLKTQKQPLTMSWGQTGMYTTSSLCLDEASMSRNLCESCTMRLLDRNCTCVPAIIELHCEACPQQTTLLSSCIQGRLKSCISTGIHRFSSMPYLRQYERSWLDRKLREAASFFLVKGCLTPSRGCDGRPECLDRLQVLGMVPLGLNTPVQLQSMNT